MILARISTLGEDPMFEAVFLTVINLVVFVGLMWLAQYWTGWGTLSHVYPSPRDFRPRQQWTFLSGWMGVREENTLFGTQKPLFSMRSCLNIAAGEEGFRLSVFPLFRLFHPPLFIPWGHVSPRNYNGIISKWTEFRLREAPSVVLRIHRSVGDDVARYSPMGTLAAE
jgi:hypothetical protein